MATQDVTHGNLIGSVADLDFHIAMAIMNEALEIQRSTSGTRPSRKVLHGIFEALDKRTGRRE
jgi:hypothetical protein